jgi:hypothetical protein
VVVLSLLFFRGPLAAVVPLVAIYAVSSAAFGLIVLASLASGLELSVGTPETVTVVLFPSSSRSRRSASPSSASSASSARPSRSRSSSCCWPA